MSLFLRIACQERLDAVGLANYHVQIDESSKVLQIVGECGQTLTNITGIRMSRMAPPMREIDLAVDLFDSFLAKHTGTFKEFIAAKAKADQVKIPDKFKALQQTELYQDYSKNWSLKFVPKAYIFKNEKSYTSQVSDEGRLKLSPPDVNVLKNPEKAAQLIQGLTAEEFKEIQSWVDAVQVYTKALARKEELLKTLNSCEI